MEAIYTVVKEHPALTLLIIVIVCLIIYHTYNKDCDSKKACSKKCARTCSKSSTSNDHDSDDSCNEKTEDDDRVNNDGIVENLVQSGAAVVPS